MRYSGLGLTTLRREPIDTKQKKHILRPRNKQEPSTNCLCIGTRHPIRSFLSMLLRDSTVALVFDVFLVSGRAVQGNIEVDRMPYSSGFQPEGDPLGGCLPFFLGSRELFIKIFIIASIFIFRVWNHFLS